MNWFKTIIRDFVSYFTFGFYVSDTAINIEGLKQKVKNAQVCINVEQKLVLLAYC